MAIDRLYAGNEDSVAGGSRGVTMTPSIVITIVITGGGNKRVESGIHTINDRIMGPDSRYNWSKGNDGARDNAL